MSESELARARLKKKWKNSLCEEYWSASSPPPTASDPPPHLPPPSSALPRSVVASASPPPLPPLHARLSPPRPMQRQVDQKHGGEGHVNTGSALAQAAHKLTEDGLIRVSLMFLFLSVCVRLLLQYLLQSCSRGGRGIVEDSLPPSLCPVSGERTRISSLEGCLYGGLPFSLFFSFSCLQGFINFFSLPDGLRHLFGDRNHLYLCVV